MKRKPWKAETKPGQKWTRQKLSRSTKSIEGPQNWLLKIAIDRARPGLPGPNRSGKSAHRFQIFFGQAVVSLKLTSLITKAFTSVEWDQKSEKFLPKGRFFFCSWQKGVVIRQEQPCLSQLYASGAFGRAPKLPVFARSAFLCIWFLWHLYL